MTENERRDSITREILRQLHELGVQLRLTPTDDFELEFPRHHSPELVAEVTRNMRALFPGVHVNAVYWIPLIDPPVR